MGEYYFDIETYSPEKKPNPEKDKIITIQFQRIDLKTGNPLDSLIILKEWEPESSEKEIVTKFYNKFFKDGMSEWDFVPVGENLNFEFEFLISKFEKYLGKKLTSRDLHYERPHLDLKHIAVLLKGDFRGASLKNFANKPDHNKDVPIWYKNKEFDKIERYIKDEADAFLEFLQKIRRNIHMVLK